MFGKRFNAPVAVLSYQLLTIVAYNFSYQTTRLSESLVLYRCDFNDAHFLSAWGNGLMCCTRRRALWDILINKLNVMQALIEELKLDTLQWGYNEDTIMNLVLYSIIKCTQAWNKMVTALQSIWISINESAQWMRGLGKGRSVSNACIYTISH